jgi:hypothetical protein
MKILSPKSKIFIIILLLTQAVVFGQSVGDYRSNGNVTFAAATNWQIYNGTAWVNATIAPKDASYTISNTITVQSSHTATVSITVTIVAQLTVEGIFTLNSSANLSIGPMVVNYNGPGNAVIVDAGSALTVNGNLTVTKGDMNVAGTVYIAGNFSTNTGNVDVTGGGSISSSGSMTTQGSGTIFGSTNDCLTGPCSGAALCTSFAATISNNQTICAGSTPATLTSTTTASSPTYQWQSSTTSGAGFTDILTNGTNSTYIFPLGLSQTTYYRLKIKSTCTVVTSQVTITVTPTIVGGMVIGGTTICSGYTSGTLTLSGHTGTVVKWQSSVSPFSTWTDIANTATTYTSGALTATTQYRAVVQNGSCLAVNSAATTVTVDPTTVGGIVAGGTTICSGSISGLLTLSGHTGTITKWQSSVFPFSTWTDIANTATTYTSGALSATTQFRAVVQSGVCTVATSGPITVTVSNPLFWANLQWPSSGNICEGGYLTASGQVYQPGVTEGNNLQGVGITVEFGYATVNTDPSTWTNWTAANFNGLGGGNNNDEYQYAFTPPSNGTYYYTFRYRSGSCNWQYGGTGGFLNGSTSVNGVLTVNPASVGGAVSGGTTICSGNTSGLLTLSGQTGTITKWQSSVSPFSAWSDIANTAATYTSGTLSATTQFRAVVQSGVCSAATSGLVTVTVSDPVGWANLEDPPPSNICEGGSLIAFGQVYKAGVTEGYNSQGAGITAEFGYATSNTNPNTWTNWTAASFNGLGGGTQNDEYQYTFTPPSSGTYYFTFRYRSGACDWQYGGYVLNAGGFWDGTTNVNGVLTVYPIPTAPSVGTPIQPTCTLATGTITVAVQNAGETYSFDNGATFQASNTKSLLAFGSYNVIIKSPGGCISPTTIVPIKSATNIWNGSAWSNGSPPVITEDIVFNGGYNSFFDLIGTNLSACSCTVNAGMTVNINSGHTLTLTNGLTVLGNILFKNASSLVQIANAQNNSGNIKYERNIDFSTILETDYTYWSSPVAGFTLGGVYFNNFTGLFYSYGVAAGIEDWQPESSGTVMNAGKGYIINGAKSYPAPSPPPPVPSFVGVPNNGDVTVPVPYNSNFGLPSTDPNFGVSYLLGNPYPSAIDANMFLSTNSNFIEGTIYFWTHITEIQDRTLISNDPITGLPLAGTGAYAYTSDDYASYNTTGGVAAESGGNQPNGKIAAGQGFFATAKATGTVYFKNTMRVAGGTILPDGSIVNGQFFKSKDPKTTTKIAIEKTRVWLNLTNTQGAFKQTLVGYITDATNEYDSRFDGESFDGNEFVDFYSVNQDKNLVIQGRALPFDENDEVPLGFRTTINGAFTINIDQVDGLLTNQAVFIEDKLTNTVTDLKSGNYTFNTVAGTFNDRFVLRYIDNSGSKTLVTTNFDSQANKVLVSNKNKQIKINSFADTIDKVTIYDLAGRQIYQKDKVNNNELSIANLVSSHQALVVKTSLLNGKTVTDKIIF